MDMHSHLYASLLHEIIIYKDMNEDNLSSHASILTKNLCNLNLASKFNLEICNLSLAFKFRKQMQ